MTDINITLQPHQIYYLPHEFKDDNVTISGSASAIVVNRGALDLDGNGSFKIVGPQLQGHGTIDVGSSNASQFVELGSVGRGETVHLEGLNAATLRLDKPLQFLGTIHGQPEYSAGEAVSLKPFPGGQREHQR